MKQPVSAIISGIHNVNALGVLRGLRKRGIPVMLNHRVSPFFP